MNNNLVSSYPSEFQEITNSKLFGFWVYLMSDCILFATLFTTFAVLRFNYAQGPSGSEIFNLPVVLIETLCLLSSSFSCGLAIYSMHQNKKNALIVWLMVTFILGLCFIGIEIHEFYHLTSEGNGPDRSAFLSAFFGLVGTHGAHVFFGLIWIMLMIFQIIRNGLFVLIRTRLILLSMFWHFLDIIWVCIFTIVYLIGKLP